MIWVGEVLYTKHQSVIEMNDDESGREIVLKRDEQQLTQTPPRIRRGHFILDHMFLKLLISIDVHR